MILFKWLRAFGMFWYDFVVGDDWLLAVGVVVALAVTAMLADVAKVPSWWILPATVVGVISFSVLRASRKTAPPASSAPSPPLQAASPAEKPAESD